MELTWIPSVGVWTLIESSVQVEGDPGLMVLFYSQLSNEIYLLHFAVVRVPREQKKGSPERWQVLPQDADDLPFTNILNKSWFWKLRLCPLYESTAIHGRERCSVSGRLRPSLLNLWLKLSMSRFVFKQSSLGSQWERCLFSAIGRLWPLKRKSMRTQVSWCWLVRGCVRFSVSFALWLIVLKEKMCVMVVVLLWWLSLQWAEPPWSWDTWHLPGEACEAQALGENLKIANSTLS